jgi:hypothetical protein
MKRSGIFLMLILLAFPSIMIAGSLDGDVIPTATQPYNDPTVIHLPCGIEIDTRDPEIALPPELVLRAPQEGIGTWLVQFDGPIYEHERTALEATGALIDGYLPNYTYIVRMDQSTRGQVAELAGVNWIGDYHPGYKISYEIDLSDISCKEFLVLLYSGTDGESVRETVESAGGRMLSWQSTSAETVVRVELLPSRIPELVQLPQVKWVEPAPHYYWFNADAQWVVQTWVEDNRRIWDKGLTGEGQIVNSTDTGLRTSHNMYRDPDIVITTWGDYPDHRKVIAYQPVDATSTFGDEIGHGTGTACCLTGNDRPVGGSSANIGMAPDAKLYFLDAAYGPSPAGNDVETTLAKAYDGNSAGGARISSNSWGSPYSLEYDASCAQADRLMWNRPDYLVFVSAGNMPMATHTVNPADAKNVVCVGGTMAGLSANQSWPFSTPGPAGDGRIKPEIVAPAVMTTANFSSDHAESTEQGTSGSCPIAAGNATLIRQYFTDGYYPSGSPGFHGAIIPSAALLKAMLINSVEIDFAGYNVPSFKIGWGRPKLDNVLYFPEDTRKLKIVDYKNGLGTGEQYEAAVNVEGGTEPFRVTLVWTDYPAQAGADPALINDLNLEVVSPSGKTYRGNNFANNESVEGGSFDALNPVENVFVNPPETGTWQIKVAAANVPQGPQPLALVVTGAIEVTAVEETPSPIFPTDLSVSADHRIRFSLRAPADIRLDVWDVAGRRVQTLLEGQLDAGTRSVDWDTKTLPSGSYFITLRTKDKTLSAKAVVIR